MMTTPANPASSILSDADWQRLSRQTQYYVVSGFELMDKSDDYLRDDDLRQASEKGWGAAAQIIKAVAENWRAHGARHRSHWHLTALVKGLAALDPASQVESAFRDVQALHENFYENNLARSAVEFALDASYFICQCHAGLVESARSSARCSPVLPPPSHHTSTMREYHGHN